MALTRMTSSGMAGQQRITVMMFRVDNLNAGAGPDGVIAAIKALDGLAWVSVDAVAQKVRVESMAAADQVAAALASAGYSAEALAQRSGCCGGCGG
jgi:copper chaperone CopZ